MSNGSDPTAVLAALDRAKAAFEMTDLAIAVHQFAVSQIREGGVCLCD